MKISVGKWVLLLCCLLSATRCLGNPLSERNPPYAAETGGSEGHLTQHVDSEEGESNGENVPPHVLLRQGSNNPQQNVRNEEVASERRMILHNLQRNRTIDRHNTSRGGHSNTDDQVSAVGDSSSYDSHNDISISKNDSDADLQVGIHSHGDNNRDQSSNLNFAPHAQEVVPIVKRTAMPALFPEIQNRSLPRETPNPDTSGESRPSQSEISHENNTHLEMHLSNEMSMFENATSRKSSHTSTTVSVEATHSDRVLPNTDRDSVNIVEPGVEMDGNITEFSNATESSYSEKQDGSNLATDTVPLATIHIPEERPETESSGFSNDTGTVNSMNTTTRHPEITKENKYHTKGEIPEMTLPDKDHHEPEVTESIAFPRASLRTESITFSRTPINEKLTLHSTTPNSREEMLATTGIRSTLPTEQIDFLRTTFPQEQGPTERFLSTILSSSRFYSTTTVSNEEVKEQETGTPFPPSERVPEVTIRIPTEIINPEPSEPVFTTTTRVTVVPEGGSGNHGRTNYPDETVPQVTLRFPTEPMEIPSSTPVPVTETVDLNGKISPTQFESVTEKKDNKVTKGGPELNTKPSSTRDYFTVTALSSTRPGHGDSTTKSNTGSGSTTASNSPEIPNFNNTLSSTQTAFPHVTVKNSFQTNSETVSTRLSEAQFTGTISTNFDRSMPHSSVSTVSYNTSDHRATVYTASATSTTQQVATSTSEFTKGISRSLQNFTSATMENNTVDSMSGTTPSAYGTPSQRDTTINLQNITISISRSTTPRGNATLSFTTHNSERYNVTTGRPHVTARPTTKKQMTNTSTTKKPTETPKATEKPSDIYTTSPVVPPKYYICFQFLWRLNEFCLEESIFKKDLAKIMRRKANKSFEETQIKFINELCYDKNMIENKTAGVDELTKTILKVELYFTDTEGKFDVRLTVDSSEFLRIGLTSEPRYGRKLVNVQLINLNVNDNRKDYQEKGISSGMTIAVIIVIIGGFCCVCLIVLQILMHKQNEKASRNILPGPNRFSLRSLDSIALNAVPKSRPHSGFWNHGLDQSEENISSLSNPLGFNSLSNMTRDLVEIYKEYEKLPNEIPSLSCVPIGAEDKNRFANVIPISHSRVKLKKLPHEEHSEYINANFITGYNGDVHAYIATQAPLTNTIKDFWRMVWEQQSRVIIMLMTANETTQPRDPAYVPDTEGVNGRVKYGDIVLVLKKKEVRQEYIMSLLEVKDIENNLIREIRHFWFTSWPVDSIPEPISVIKLILDTRVHYEDSGAPLVVHCSSGTGRSGTMIAIDICMRSYESKRVVDILGCVNNMRKERAGLVQNKEQYALIYKTLNEYAVIMGSPRLAPSSSSAIQLQHML